MKCQKVLKVSFSDEDFFRQIWSSRGKKFVEFFSNVLWILYNVFIALGRRFDFVFQLFLNPCTHQLFLNPRTQTVNRFSILKWKTKNKFWLLAHFFLQMQKASSKTRFGFNKFYLKITSLFQNLTLLSFIFRFS